jgi:hypothetical protein
LSGGKLKVKVLGEYGYQFARLGFSLSYGTTTERAEKILPAFAFGRPGESKFLESIYLWVDVLAPRFWWIEADTYRLTTKQSESTMHTGMKQDIVVENFEYPIPLLYIDYMNEIRKKFKECAREDKTKYKLEWKNALPEGFLQRRIWVFNYKTLQNIYIQRISHELPQWEYFLTKLLRSIEHPEFIVKGEYESKCTT